MTTPIVRRRLYLAPISDELPLRVRWVRGYFGFMGYVGLAGFVVSATQLLLWSRVPSYLSARPWFPLVALARGAGWLLARRALADGERRGAVLAIVALLPGIAQAFLGTGVSMSVALTHGIAAIGLLSVWKRLR